MWPVIVLMFFIKRTGYVTQEHCTELCVLICRVDIPTYWSSLQPSEDPHLQVFIT